MKVSNSQLICRYLKTKTGKSFEQLHQSTFALNLILLTNINVNHVLRISDKKSLLNKNKLSSPIAMLLLTGRGVHGL